VRFCALNDVVFNLTRSCEVDELVAGWVLYYQYARVTIMAAESNRVVAVRWVQGRVVMFSSSSCESHRGGKFGITEKGA
jgi:hypothetical protein